MTALKKYGPTVAILLLAAYLRWVNIGAEYLDGDHAFISIRAIRIARYHEAPLLGPPMAIGLWHSPVSVYLYAIPYLFSPDARIARAFTGLMNVVAVGLMYALGARYFDRKAAATACLLYAAHPFMITAGRAINNAQLGAPFAVATVLTGLLGYYEDKRWARLFHLPLLSVAGQCHPHTFALAPVSLLLLAAAWRKRPERRWRLSMDFAISAAIGAIMMVPWGIGLYRVMQEASLAGALSTTLSDKGFEFTYTLLSHELAGPDLLRIALILPATTMLGAVWLVARAFHGPAGLPGLVSVAAFFLMPAIAVVFKIHLVIDYFWPTFPFAFLIQGAFIGGVRSQPGDAGAWKWNGLLNDRYLRWVTWPLIAAVAITFLWFLASYDRREGLVSLEEQINAMDAASAQARQTGRDLLIVAPDGWDELMPWEFLRESEILKTGLDARVVLPWRGMPLPDAGAVLLGPAAYTGRPSIFSDGDIIFNSSRVGELPPARDFNPDLVQLTPIRLSNGASILGFLAEPRGSLPAPGQPWTVFLIWRVDSLANEENTVFVHLVNANGDKYAQIDMPALPVGQQRIGERVLNEFNFQLGEGLPAAGPLYLRFGMYSESGQAKVVDDTGNVTGDYGLIQIRGQAEPLMTWENGLALDSLTMNSPLIQGPPLDVTATWHVRQTPVRDLHLRWRVTDVRGATMFETNMNLDLALALSQLPAGAFATEHYSLRIPTDIPAGAYSLELQWANSEGDAVGTAHLTDIEILARDRRFDTPEMAHVVEANHGDVIRLLGFDSQLDEKTLRLTLHWRAIGPTMRDYKYFVHVWRDGKVVAQVDSMPATYQYLTSWWAPNEVVSETLTVDLSALDAGPYTLTTGFYDPATGERLPVTLTDGTQLTDHWVTLQTIVLR